MQVHFSWLWVEFVHLEDAIIRKRTHPLYGFTVYYFEEWKVLCFYYFERNVTAGHCPFFEKKNNNFHLDHLKKKLFLPEKQQISPVPNARIDQPAHF